MYMFRGAQNLKQLIFRASIALSNHFLSRSGWMRGL